MFINLVTAGSFFAICLLAFLLGEWVRSGKGRARLLADLHGEQPGVNGRRKSPPGVVLRGLAGVIPQMASEVDAIERDLNRAGYYRPGALIEYMATRNFMIVAVLIVAGSLAVLADPATNMPEMFLIGGLITAALGYGLARTVLHHQATQRVARIENGLPDALDILRMCLTSGLPLREALKRVSEEIEFMHPDIAVEFELIRRQSEADTMPNALKQFARRIDTPDVNALAALVSQTEKMGTHVSAAVTEYADSVRRTCQQRAQERASKGSIKMLFPVVLCLAPPIYILLVGPPLLRLYDFMRDSNRPGGILNTNITETATPPVRNPASRTPRTPVQVNPN